MRPRIPIEAAPDQRFLRSPQNLRVRKVRRARSLVRALVIAVANAVVLAAVVQGARGAIQALRSTPEFALAEIEVHGNARVSRESIEARLAPWTGRSMLEIDLAAAEAEVEQEPWVLDAVVRRVLPGRLVVTVRERVPAALALVDGSVLLVDDTGHAIGPLGERDVESLPVVTGLDARNPVHRALRLVRGVEALDVVARVAPTFARTVSEIDVSLPDRVALRTVDGGPWILLDPERVERNLSAFLDLRPEIERLAGPASTIDLRWRDRIALTPRTPTPMGEHG